MSFVPRIELDIHEDESILPVNLKPPWPSAFFIKFCVDHSINVFYPTRNFQSFAGVGTQLCELLIPVKIGRLSTSDLAHKFSSEIVITAFDASFNHWKTVPVVEIKVDLWLQYYEGIVKHFIAGYVSEIMEKGTKVDFSSLQLMKRIKLGRRSSMEQCSICLESLGGEEPALQLRCSHIYRPGRVRKWFKDSPSCPLSHSHDE
ncbi:unnamed protein product [Dovyalis caffra]|uniref:RING-type domain-containing protein n=1 Tax=Dovyalis caffra TaxID=77055 RepID=A0AAV1RIG4_9ROSI|nr:unnamed protein product [Dovyalis caffra]